MEHGTDGSEQRKSFTLSRLKQFESRFSDVNSAFGGTTSGCVAENVCVCATGSYGRGEANEGSDLDLVILENDVCNLRLISGYKGLSNLKEIQLKASLIEAARRESFPEFDADGRFLRTYRTSSLISGISKPTDDSDNTFTTRLLILLESRPVIGESIHSAVLKELIGVYWHDFEEHKQNFIPAFFINDVLRLWRTFCINYEGKVLENLFDSGSGQRRDRAAQILAIKAKHFKLKYSRLMTCFATLVYLLSLFQKQKTVTIDDTLKMLELSPVERLKACVSHSDDHLVKELSTQALEEYDWFLEKTTQNKEELREYLSNPNYKKERNHRSKVFHFKMTRLVLRFDADILQYLFI